MNIYILLIAILLANIINDVYGQTKKPTLRPTFSPTRKPSAKPTLKPTRKPTHLPTSYPTSTPTSFPTSFPTAFPTSFPTAIPHHAHEENDDEMTGGGILAIVFVSLTLSGLLVAYLYHSRHNQYVKRFVNITMDGFHQAASILQKPSTSSYGRYAEEDFDDRKSNASDESCDDEETGLTLKKVRKDDYSVYKSKNQRIKGTVNPLYAGSPVTSEVKETIKLNNIKISGYLYKLSTRGQWLRRFFFVKDGALYYSQTEFNLLSASETSSISAVLVANLIISTVKDSERDLEFSIISPGDRGSGNGGGTYCLRAENIKDFKKWVSAIKNEIATHLSNNPAQNSSPSLILSSTAAFNAGNISASEYYFNPPKKILNQIYSNNNYCCDCGSSNSKPEWTSINFFSNLCIECSGIHRSLGTHISKIRSLSLDKWNQNLLDLVLYFTNEKVNRILEETFDQSLKSSSDFSIKEFINNKYNLKSYLKKGDAFTTKYWTNKIFEALIQGDLSNLYEAIIHGGLLNEFFSNGVSQKSDQKGNKADLVTLSPYSSATSASYDGMTPLMIAAKNGDYLSAELLIQWGASLDITHNTTNKTAYDYAKESKYPRIISTFENK